LLILQINLFDIDSEQKLVPNLRSVLPKDITKYVIDELGYILLNYLEFFFGLRSFQIYLKIYLNYFRFKSVSTSDWINHLCDYFEYSEEVSSSV